MENESKQCIHELQGDNLLLNGMKLGHVVEYSLKHSAGKPAELTLTIEVNVNQVDFESVK